MIALNKHLKIWSIRLFFLSQIIIVGFGSYFYKHPQVNLGSITIVNPYYAQIATHSKDIPDWLYTVDYFTFIFVLSFGIILFMTIYYNTNKNIKEKNDKKSIEIYIRNILTFLYPIEEYSESQIQQQLKDLKKIALTNHQKELLINTLRKIHSQTTGKVREKTDYLMGELKYGGFIKAYLHSPYFNDKLFALKVIADFQIPGFEKHILILTKKRNEVLHSEAIITLLKLKIYDSLLFLVDLKMRLTVWDINVIIKIVQELKIVNIDYQTLINSEIPEISTLGIMLARLNNRIDFKSEIQNKIGNSNDLVNEEACIAFSYFSGNENDYDFVIEKFELATEKAQFQFINKIASINNKEKAIKFLDWVIENQSFTQKVQALIFLLDLDIIGMNKYKESNNPLIRQSYYQVIDINI